MGLRAHGALDIDALRHRVSDIQEHLHDQLCTLLSSQGVRLVSGVARFKDPHTVVADTADGLEELTADVVLVSTGSRPRIPTSRRWTGSGCSPPGRSTRPRDPCAPVVIGSGVTGVEFTHMFASLGSQVTLLVSRQQVLPIKDAEVAAVLEEAFLERGVRLLKGARASAIARDGDTVRVTCEDGRTVDGSHVVLAVGSLPNSEGLGPRGGRPRGRRRRLHPGEPQLPHQRRPHLRRR